MPINYANADYIRGLGVIQIGNTGLVNLNVLNTTNAGPGTGPFAAPDTSQITTPAGSDNILNVGESFTISRTVKPGYLGSNETLTYTMRGSGTYGALLGGSHDVIVADRVNSAGLTESVVIFPYSDAPTSLLGGIGSLVAVNLSTQAVGWDFNANAPLCFTRGTLLDTPRGLCAIEDLRAGDLVLTRDNGAQPIRWIGSRVLSAGALRHSPDMRPVRIRAGALGQGTPAADLVVSPQHRILVRSRVAQRMFGTDEVLVAAKQLLQLDGVDICDETGGVEYFHMLFDRHEVVFANGAEAESLFTGPQAIRSVGAAALAEIHAIFPELQDGAHAPQGARMLLSGRKGRKLVARHAQHHKPLVAAP